MDNANGQQNIVSSFPPPPPYFRLFDHEDKVAKIKPPPCIEGPFTCFGSQLSSDISIHPLDSDTILYNESNVDLPAELMMLNEMFQMEILKLLENSGKGVVDTSSVKKIIKIYNNMNHILEKLRIIQTYHQICDELEAQVNEKNQLLDQMKQHLEEYKSLLDDLSKENSGKLSD
ncbi:hypothetical protein [Cryptosporidium parvum Iowa II]|uniref:Mediator of RNA polymerase II transcription subunit 7 n=2 Tax=Cryptosporidium parvum TaxID=5807 RepID=Q5CSG5_CRYPI|nr:hypothetical protein [Cryptosporidium parvum Iowa II]EAK88353.1 conserved hypothetical protein [Cryptosporidium parvum Iowa II]QOY43344.1 Mediator complex subunit Med7 [Cryptosporidium parvum]WKS76184.1 hypothetical protein CPCDC_1g2800 [Cryptosporidium sp. 43IA8]WRK30676.1 Mediator complex subunit Med7 [Cryptosporidium parvum]|eukprot:QOY43344.1 hypothetical protein CPATCC_000123 [Cryptosporidium parvum]